MRVRGGASDALADSFHRGLVGEGLEVLALCAVAPSLEDIFIARVRAAEEQGGGADARTEVGS